MGNQALKAVSKKGTDNIEPPIHKSLLEVKTKVLLSDQLVAMSEQV